MTDQMNVEGLSIAPGVMETIISVAASEVDGVASLGSFATSGIRSMLASKPSTSGIETKMGDDSKLSVAVHVEVYYGYVLQMCIRDSASWFALPRRAASERSS